MRRLAATFVLAVTLPFAARAVPSCKNISVTPLTFSPYSVYDAAPLDTVATISYSCPPPAVPTVTIDAGLHSNGSYAPRYMQLTTGTELLGYDVYVDAARTIVWGATPVSLPQGNGLTAPIYGRVTAGQDVSVGTYTDTLTVTFNF